jgi:opacity protein-like surface antigen
MLKDRLEEGGQSNGRAPSLCAGISRRSFTETIASPANTFKEDKTSFTLNLGGGVDYKLSDRFAWRIVEADYNRIFVRADVNTTAIPNHTLNGFRFSNGIVIK